MKQTASLLMSVLVLTALPVVAAEAPAAPTPTFEIAAADLIAAGYSEAKEIKPAGDRFLAPVRYFRVSPALSPIDAKKDCKDCGNLAAVYAGETKTAPAWANRTDLIYSAGGRVQIRRYLAAKKLAVIVSAPDRTLAIKLANDLIKKFSE
jgi:hypothetical protein